VFNASISQQNIFGSGNAIIASLNTSKVNRTISLAFTQPYWTVDGVSRTLEIYQRNIDTASLDVTSYTSSTYGGAIGFGVPVTEADTINFGFRIERTNIEFPPAIAIPSRDRHSAVLPVRRRDRHAVQQLHRVRRLVS
jgi:outer membrane protein insertion porin family